MSTDNPWIDDRTPEDLILSRKPVSKLTEQVVAQLVLECETAIRNKNVNSTMAALSLDFSYSGPELKNGKLELSEGNRDKFLIALCGTFVSSACVNYSMKAESIKITSDQYAEATLIVRNPNDSEFEKYYGPEVREKIFISLYKNRPVVSRLEIENAS
jgi:hypothetical protein